MQFSYNSYVYDKLKYFVISDIIGLARNKHLTYKAYLTYKAFLAGTLKTSYMSDLCKGILYEIVYLISGLAFLWFSYKTVQNAIEQHRTKQNKTR